MTLEELNKKRDELAEQELGDHCYPYMRGWDKAVETLWPEIEKATEIRKAASEYPKMVDSLLLQRDKIEEQNKKLIEALKEIKAEKKDTCSVCNAAYFIPEIAEDALKEMGIE